MALSKLSGALIARIVLQPIEETSRIFFSKALSVEGKGSGKAFENAVSRLTSILLAYNHVSLLILALGPSYLPVVLAVLLPPKYVLHSKVSLGA